MSIPHLLIQKFLDRIIEPDECDRLEQWAHEDPANVRAIVAHVKLHDQLHAVLRGPRPDPTRDRHVRTRLRDVPDPPGEDAAPE